MVKTHPLDGYFELVAYTVGALMGDGHVKAYMRKFGGIHHRVYIGCKDEDIIQIAKDQVNLLFETNYEVGTHTNPHGTLIYTLDVGRKNVYHFFHYFIRDKLTLPEVVFRASRKAQLEFLAGLFDTDGGIGEGRSPDHKHGIRWSIYYTAKHRTLVEDVVRLLEELGVKPGKISVSFSKAYQSITYNISPNIRSFVAAGCYFALDRKARRLRRYLVYGEA